jgi:hypothetical protein
MLDYLKDIDVIAALQFKTTILQYKSQIQQDVVYLREKYCNPSTSNMLDEFKNRKIKFYTLYFYLKANNILIDDLINSSRVLGAMLQRVKQLMLFITFKQEAINSILMLFDESNILKGE